MYLLIFSIRLMGRVPGLCGSKLQSQPTGSRWAPLLEVSLPMKSNSSIWYICFKEWYLVSIYPVCLCACVITQLREQQPCTPLTWWRLVCRTRDLQDHLLESWCIRTALTVPRRCSAMRGFLASIEVGFFCHFLLHLLWFWCLVSCTCSMNDLCSAFTKFPIMPHRSGSSAYRCGTWEGYQTDCKCFPSPHCTMLTLQILVKFPQ